MAIQPKDPNKPAGTGSIVKSTVFLDGNSRILHRVDGEILQVHEGKEIKKSRPGNLVVVKFDKIPMKIYDIVDRSESYRVTREIIMRPLSKDELKANTTEVSI